MDIWSIVILGWTSIFVKSSVHLRYCMLLFSSFYFLTILLYFRVCFVWLSKYCWLTSSRVGLIGILCRMEIDFGECLNAISGGTQLSIFEFLMRYMVYPFILLFIFALVGAPFLFVHSTEASFLWSKFKFMY